MVFVDDVKLKVFHLLSEATLQGNHSMGALCEEDCEGIGWGDARQEWVFNLSLLHSDPVVR